MKKLVNGSANWKLVTRKQLPSGNGSVTKAWWNSTVFMMNSVFLLIATTVKPSTMIRWMKSLTSWQKKDFSKNLKVPKWLILKNTVSNTQPSSKNQMVRHFTSHVTWLLPSTVNVLTTLPKPSMWLVMNNLPTSNSWKLFLKKWVTTGLTTWLTLPLV